MDKNLGLVATCSALPFHSSPPLLSHQGAVRACEVRDGEGPQTTHGVWRQCPPKEIAGTQTAFKLVCDTWCVVSVYMYIVCECVCAYLCQLQF